MDDQQLPSLRLLVAVVVIGFTAGWLVSQAGSGMHGDEITFRHQAWYTVWSALGALFVGLWLILGVVALSQVWSLALEEKKGTWNRVKLMLMPAIGCLAGGIAAVYIASGLSSRA